LLIASAGAISADAASRTEKRVERLASSNQEPHVSAPTAKQVVRLAEDYDAEEQKRIYKIWSKLAKDEDTDLAVLVKHIGDERYSFTADIGGRGYSNYDVGRVCLAILSSKLDAIEPFPFQYKSYAYWVIAKDPAAWLKENGDKSLLDLQLQSIEWFLDEHKAEQDKGYRRVQQIKEELLRDKRPFPPRANERLKHIQLPK
jgi:hypothetical protein